MRNIEYTFQEQSPSKMESIDDSLKFYREKKDNFEEIIKPLDWADNSAEITAGPYPKKELTQEQREEIVKIADNLAGYLFNQKINNIIFLDRSARLGYLALIKSWRKLFPTIKCPDIYFTNPDGYNTQFEKKDVKSIAKEFDRAYKKLASKKHEKIMLFDTCMHSGETLRPVLEVLKKAGYSKVLVGLTQPKDYFYRSGIKVNFSALKNQQSKCCYPFGRGELMTKMGDGLICSQRKDSEARKYFLKLRKELAEIYKD